MSSLVILVTAVTQAVLLVAAAAGGWWWKVPWWHGLALPTARTATQAVVMGLSSGALAAAVVISLTRRFPGLGAALGEVVIPFFQHLPPGTAAVIVSGSAVGEEIFFRGFLQPVVGVFPQAVIFGLLHYGFRRELLAYGVLAAVAGLWLGYLYAATGVLWTSLVAHAVYNVIDLLAIRYGLVGQPGRPGCGASVRRG